MYSKLYILPAIATFIGGTNGLSIGCADDQLAGGPGGTEGVPFVHIIIDGQDCDAFTNTLGTCEGTQYSSPAGPLKGPGGCQGGNYWFDGDLNYLDSSGNHYYCSPIKIIFPMQCDAGSGAPPGS